MLCIYELYRGKKLTQLFPYEFDHYWWLYKFINRTNPTYMLENYVGYKWLIVSFTVYIITISLYPVWKSTIMSYQSVWLYVSNLSIILVQYIIILMGIIWGNLEIYINFSISSIFSNIIDFNISFALTPLSFSFSFLVLIIGLATNIYILNYFKGEADEGGFIFWINSFIISMLILVLSNNFFTLFMGWELIGLTSFFLINFWQSKRSTLKSSFKAFSFNLVSDLLLLGALVIFYYLTNTTDISIFLYLVSWGGLTNINLINLGIGMLIGCASIKSVQIFGHLWLPDSMEAPVPASSLIHSATLVSAGIYILVRFNILINVYSWNNFLINLGALTAVYGGIVAASQTDMKKLLAYSTMSHCGFLMVLVAFSNFFILIVYLFLHGLFKASTFFCSGSFIRVYGTQDTRIMGGAQRIFLLDSILLLLCGGNLCGLPFTIGLLYKSYFFKILLYSNTNTVIVGFLLIGMLMGNIYFFRLTYYVIFDLVKWTKLSIPNILMMVSGRGGVFKEEANYMMLSKTHTNAVLIIFLTSISLYISFLWLINTNIVEFGNINIVNNFLPAYIFTSILQVYEVYFIYFYIIYLFIIILLVLLNWRKQYSWNTKSYFCLYLIHIVLLGNLLL